MSQIMCAACGAFVRTVNDGSERVMSGQCPKCEKELFRSHPEKEVKPPAAPAKVVVPPYVKRA
jgi:predicted  nucleic acid-binding Zn-ribbon protein